MLPLLALVLAVSTQDAPIAPAPVVIDGVPEVHEVKPPDDLVGRLARPVMFDLTRYSLYAERRVPEAADGLRFDEEIEVFGRTKDPNEALAAYWRYWNFEYGLWPRHQRPVDAGRRVQHPAPHRLPAEEGEGREPRPVGPDAGDGALARRRCGMTSKDRRFTSADIHRALFARRPRRRSLREMRRVSEPT